MGDRATLSELYLQVAKARAFEVIEEMIDAADGFRFDYGAMREFLEALTFPHRAIPSEEEYRALIDGKRPSSVTHPGVSGLAPEELKPYELPAFQASEAAIEAAAANVIDCLEGFYLTEAKGVLDAAWDRIRQTHKVDAALFRSEVSAAVRKDTLERICQQFLRRQPK